MDPNPCTGEQRERRYLSGQVLDSHDDVNPALEEREDSLMVKIISPVIHMFFCIQFIFDVFSTVISRID